MIKKLLIVVIMFLVSFVLIAQDNTTSDIDAFPNDNQINQSYEVQVNRNYYEMTLGGSLNLGAPGDITIRPGAMPPIPLTSAFLTYAGVGVPFSMAFYNNSGEFGVGFTVKTSYNCTGGIGLTSLMMSPMPYYIYITHDFSNDFRLLVKYGKSEMAGHQIFEAGFTVVAKIIDPIFTMQPTADLPAITTFFAGPSFLFGRELIAENFAVSVGFTMEALIGYARDVFNPMVLSQYIQYLSALDQNLPVAQLKMMEAQIDTMFPESFNAILRFGVEIRWSYCWSQEL